MMNKKQGIPITILSIGFGLTTAFAGPSFRPLPPAGVAAKDAAFISPIPQRNVTVPQITLDSFDQQKISLNSTHVESASQINQNLALLDGKVLDLQGQVMGIMALNSQETVLLKLDIDTISLQIPAAFADSSLLLPGATVRVLVNVHAPTDAPMQLSVIALAAPSTSAAIAKTPDTSAVVLPPLAGTIAALPAPPQDIAEAVAKPSYQAQAQTVPQGNSVQTTSPSTPTTDLDAVVAAQKVAYVQMIQNTNKKLKPAQANEIADAILRAGLKYQMDPRFLAAVIGVESDYDNSCLSNSGAMGLGQLMPFNLKEAGVTDPWNPTQNIFGTAKLLRGHLNDYKDRPNGTLLAVAAYNAGPGAVRRAGFQVPNGAQVRRYVWKIYYRYKALAPDMF
ncbi:MAG: lytic transglycosylase domain-containing protein [Abditibacteriaceae bacterium]